MKFALCAIAGRENLYIREWVEYHLKVGFDMIYVYRNDTVEDPRLVLMDYIMSNKVCVFDWFAPINRSSDGNKLDEYCRDVQNTAYNDCINKYGELYDWMAFFDIDEFLYFDNYPNINKWFESTPAYNEFEQIVVNWYTMSDDGNLFYDSRPVQERFKKHSFGLLPNGVRKDQQIKCIIKPSTKYRFINSPHHVGNINDQPKTCDVSGVQIEGSFDWFIKQIKYHPAHIKHYYTKSLMEFLYRKLKNTNDYDNIAISIKTYRNINGWSETHTAIVNEFIENMRSPNKSSGKKC